MARDTCLLDTPGYVHSGSPSPSAVFRWSWTAGGDIRPIGNGGAQIGSGTGFAQARGDTAFAAVCAGSTQATLSYEASNAVQGLKIPTGDEVFAQALQFFGLILGDGFNDYHCSLAQPGCAYRIDFNDTDFGFQVSPASTVE